MAGRSLRSLSASAELNLPENSTITAEHIEKLKSDVSKDKFDQFEILSVVPRKFIVDKTIFKNPSGILGSTIKAYFNLIVGKNQIKLNLKRIIEERLELKIKDYMPTALCVAEQVLTHEERQLGCVLVDFGAETLTISL